MRRVAGMPPVRAACTQDPGHKRRAGRGARGLTASWRHRVTSRNVGHENGGAGHCLAGTLPGAALDLHGSLHLRPYAAAVAGDDTSVTGNSARYRRTTVSRKLSSYFSFLQATSSM